MAQNEQSVEAKAGAKLMGNLKTSFANAVRPMPPRDPHEPVRAATPLELLFDLVSVIAIAAAAAGLHHAISENHTLDGIIRFGLAFFAIWWAWMNYTWFASAYDNNDAPFRLLTMVIMAGALAMAAGIGQFFKSLDLTLVVGGYVVMRLAMVALWLRTARHDPERRTTTLRYAFGIAAVQIYWVAFVLLQPQSEFFFYALFVFGGVLELFVPVFAERASQTPWHRHHMIERYGLLNIIVLGETLLAGSIALAKAFGEHFEIVLVHIALSALVVVFSMWWLYFAEEDHLDDNKLSKAFVWAYGHILIYASGAAVGAGFAVLVDVVTNHAKVGLLVGVFAVAVPVALYLIGLWFVRDRFVFAGAAQSALPVFALLIVLAPLTPLGLEGVAALVVLCVLVRNGLSRAE